MKISKERYLVPMDTSRLVLMETSRLVLMETLRLVHLSAKTQILEMHQCS